MFVFDWINWSQLKHLLDPEAIVNSDGQCSVDLVMTRSCLTKTDLHVSLSVSSWHWIFLSSSATPPGPHGQCQGHQALSNDQCQHCQCQTQCRMLSHAFWVMDCPWESNEKFLKLVNMWHQRCQTKEEVFYVLLISCVCLGLAWVNIGNGQWGPRVTRANDWPLSHWGQEINSFVRLAPLLSQ